VCRGCLPTRIRLLDKGVNCPTHCASCASNHEDLMHVFFDCPFALQVWNITGLWHSVQYAISITDSARAAIFHLLENLSVKLTQRLSTVIWSIWKHRNLKVWEDATKTIATVVERARSVVEDWRLANAPDLLASSSTQQPSQTPSSHQHRTVWQPPVVGRYKCNIDATFSSHNNRTSIGICVRDAEGTFVLAKAFTYSCMFPVEAGEALGLHVALQWMSDMKFDNVDFETNSKLTVDAFLSSRNDLSEFGYIISSCRSLFCNFFSNSRVEFV